MRCPACGLENEDYVEKCDCGFSLDGSMDSNSHYKTLRKTYLRKTAARRYWIWLFIIVNVISVFLSGEVFGDAGSWVSISIAIIGGLYLKKRFKVSWSEAIWNTSERAPFRKVR